jgi:gliding motility-associated-like protein
MRKLIPILIIVSFFIFTKASAQNKEGANWIFGGRIQLNFNSEKPAVDTFAFTTIDTLMNGAASVSDRSGELLFFSSGGILASRLKVNGIYQAMPNGNFFTDSIPTLTTAEMIVQSPADSNLYYLFFNGYKFINNVAYQDFYRLQIDMRLNNGYGDVVPNSLQLVRKEVGNYKLTALLHQNGRDTWVVGANRTIDSVFAYLLTPGGILPPVVTKVTNRFHSISRMKASPNSEMFAVGSVLGPGIEGLDIYDFNRATGIPTLKYSLPTPIYDYPFFSCAFSPDNSMLYAGSIGIIGFPKNATVYQYDLTFGNTSQVQQSRNVIYNTASSYSIYDMQLAIDGKIYLIIEKNFLSQISCPNLYGAACRFKANTIDLKGRIKGLTLPALNQTIFRNANKLQAQAFRNRICEGDTVQLSAYGAGAEKFKWQLANGLTVPSDTLASPFVSPTVTTTYQVIGSSVCHSDTAFIKVTVVQKPKAIAISGPLQVYTFAEKQPYLVQNPTIGNKYTWEVIGGTIESGQGQSSILVNWENEGTGSVSVTESNATGCAGKKVSIPVQISGEPQLAIYNVFTPNNDGKNDAFTIENLKWYPQNELKIYNRWGVEIFKSSNYQNNWKAENVSSGVYYYIFKTKGRSWKGWLEVIK